MTAPISPPSHLRRDVSATTARRGPTRFANSIKYRDKGKKNARGFAGAASLEARALLGINGSTTLDVATGTIDNPDASRLLNKIQLKQFAPNGTLQTTTSYKNLSSPTYQTTLAGRVRGSKLGVQGTVVGVDGKHSDIVSATETVKLRPDVSVDRIFAPGQARMETPIQISALISEKNGDVGANTVCVLAVDGVDVGRGSGVWVDAGRSVSCIFNHIFTERGTKQLTVRAESVNPGDWDASNNSTTQAINIYVPNDFTWFGSYFSLRDYVGTKFSEGYYIFTDNGARTDYRVLENWRRNESWQSNVSGHLPLMTGPLTFAFRDEVDGQLLTDFQFDPATASYLEFNGTYEDPDFGTVAQHIECIDEMRLEPIVFEGFTVNVSPAFVRVCSQTHTSAAGPIPDRAFTDFQYGTNAGDVSYYTEDFQQVDDPDPNFDNTHIFNGDVEYMYGNLKFGNDYSFVFKIFGADQTKIASGTIHATTFHTVISFPYRCEDYDAGTFTGHDCQSGDYSYTITAESAQGVPGAQ
ncbi:MAG: hypothetical protein ACJ8AK_16135 [Gemmatimonadaceae bacterium]